MKVLKKIGKVMAILFLILMVGLAVLDIYLIKMPELRAKVKIDGIEDVVYKIEGLTIHENVKVIGLGEASHGNAEFQELKREVLKVLVDKYNVDCFAMEIEKHFPCASEFHLDTPCWNERTNAFYKRLGYQIIKVEDGFIFYQKRKSELGIIQNFA